MTPKALVLAVLIAIAEMRYGRRRFNVWIDPREGLTIK